MLVSGFRFYTNDVSHLQVYLAAAVDACCRWQCVVALSGEYEVIVGLSSVFILTVRL